jgi:hypothetical protein
VLSASRLVGRSLARPLALAVQFVVDLPGPIAPGPAAVGATPSAPTRAAPAASTPAAQHRPKQGEDEEDEEQRPEEAEEPEAAVAEAVAIATDVRANRLARANDDLVALDEARRHARVVRGDSDYRGPGHQDECQHYAGDRSSVHVVQISPLVGDHFSIAW